MKIGLSGYGGYSLPQLGSIVYFEKLQIQGHRLPRLHSTEKESFRIVNESFRVEVSGTLIKYLNMLPHVFYRTFSETEYEMAVWMYVDLRRLYMLLKFSYDIEAARD